MAMHESWFVFTPTPSTIKWLHVKFDLVKSQINFLIYIYIYIYIYSNPLLDCFIVSQLFSVTKAMRCFKLRLKSGWFYVSKTWVLKSSQPKQVVNDFFFLFPQKNLIFFFFFFFTRGRVLKKFKKWLPSACFHSSHYKMTLLVDGLVWFGFGFFV